MSKWWDKHEDKWWKKKKMMMSIFSRHLTLLACVCLLVSEGLSDGRGGGKAYIEVSLYDRDANDDYVEKNKSILEGNYTPAGVMERAQGSLKQVGRYVVKCRLFVVVLRWLLLLMFIYLVVLERRQQLLCAQNQLPCSLLSSRPIMFFLALRSV